jgi:cyclophilin family peptidyl-prolyl cis-trans isomerase
MRRLTALAFAAVLLAGPAVAQTSEWRSIPPENLLVIDTTKGRVLIELAPEAAPQHVERIRTLTRQGFYDGVPFHRVMTGFMAQTGDPTGTGLNGSDLADLPAEFAFRRGAETAFEPVSGSDRGYSGPPGSQLGILGSLPIATQPDGQMFATRDGRVDATAWFCPGVIGAARTGDDINSANSQFFLMTGSNLSLNGAYTVWGHVVGPMDAILALQAGDPSSGRVPDAQQDRMVRVRLAADIPEAERPSASVLDVRSARFDQLVEETRAARGSAFSICDITLPSEISN